MTEKISSERRCFLRKAAQGTLAAPMLALLPSLAEALGPKKNASATDTSSEQMKPSAKPTVSLNVKDYGATGDGKTKDTLAIQQTIERCAAFGGGEVVVPAGDYLTGAPLSGGFGVPGSVDYGPRNLQISGRFNF